MAENFEFAISVVMPVYNGEQTLDSALAPLVGLLLDREIVEIIVVDDGSKDSSAWVAKEAGARSSRPAVASARRAPAMSARRSPRATSSGSSTPTSSSTRTLRAC